MKFEGADVEQFQYYLVFKDSTTGKETYGKGRMLRVEKKGDKMVIDFNYAYDPYSAIMTIGIAPLPQRKTTSTFV